MAIIERAIVPDMTPEIPNRRNKSVASPPMSKSTPETKR